MLIKIKERWATKQEEILIIYTMDKVHVNMVHKYLRNWCESVREINNPMEKLARMTNKQLTEEKTHMANRLMKRL